MTNLPTKAKPIALGCRQRAVRGQHFSFRPTSTRSYRVLYRFKGNPKEHVLHLGRVGEITLAEARSKALEARKRAAAGDDPKAEASVKASKPALRHGPSMSKSGANFV